MQTRRKFLENSIGLALLPAVPVFAGALIATPRQSTGPFYPQKLPLDNDNNLTVVAGAGRKARGEISDLSGRVLDRNGKAISGIRIEIWQCDANGRYHHPWDAGDLPLDPGFQGHGHTYSDAEGRYRFRTIRPVSYPGRTPHIHVAAFPERAKPFATQLYIAGEPLNMNDSLFRHISPEQRHLVVAEFKPTAASDVRYSADWDLILAVNANPESNS